MGACALAFGVLAPAASAGPIEHVVNSDNAGGGSLRAALANVDSGGQVVFDAPTHDPALTSQIVIDRNVTITGLGAGATTITGAPDERVFELAPSVTVTIQDVRITGGNAPDGADGAFPGGNGVAGESGGAILNENSDSSLTLRRTLIEGNSAGAGGSGAGGDGSTIGGFGNAGGTGGAILSEGTLVIESSEISGNEAGSGGSGGAPGSPPTGAEGGLGGNGGGIDAIGNVTITDSTIAENSAGDGGAGSSGSVSGNGGNGGDGGGLRYGGSGTLTLTNVTIANNEAGSGGIHGPGGGGPSYGGDGAYGGGLATTSAATLTNATIAGNTAGTGQPGFMGITPIPPDHGIGGGVAGPATLNNSILASNSAPAGDTNCDGAVLDGDFNVGFPGGVAEGCPAGFAGGNPMLGSLAANGGPSRTMAIGSASSALDLVPAAGAECPAADQRGIARPQQAACDAGAFELEPTAPPPPGTGEPTLTGQRAAALKKCKKKKRKLRKKCRKKASKLPL